MHRLNRLHCTALVLALIAFAAIAHGQAKKMDVPADQPYIHEPTGVAFPPTIEKFQRRDVHRFDEAATNVSISYRIDQFPLTTTAYAYPTGGAKLAPHFKQVCGDITTNNPTAKHVSDQDVTVKQGDRQFTYKSALYTMRRPDIDPDLELLSEVYLLIHKNHFIKFRFTYSANVNEDAKARITEILQGVTLSDAK